MITDVNPTGDYRRAKQMADNPIQMAMQVIELQKHFRQQKRQSDPNMRQSWIERLKVAAELSNDANGDAEQAHQDVDDILLEIINDPEISDIYGKVQKWYS